MSRNELLDAYQAGRISRRTFVKGMAALGFSVTVANVLADRVRAAGSGGARRLGDDAYDDAYDDVYGGDTGGVALPTTGSGSKSGSSWMAPIAVVGAGAAAAAAFLRKKTGENPVE